MFYVRTEGDSLTLLVAKQLICTCTILHKSLFWWYWNQTLKYHCSICMDTQNKSTTLNISNAWWVTFKVTMDSTMIEQRVSLLQFLHCPSSALHFFHIGFVCLYVDLCCVIVVGSLQKQGLYPDVCHTSNHQTDTFIRSNKEACISKFIIWANFHSEEVWLKWSPFFIHIICE